MSRLKIVVVYPFAFLGILLLKTLGFLIFRNSKGKRIMTISSTYAEITSANRKTVDRKDLEKDYDFLGDLAMSMELVERKSSLELPLFLQRFFSWIFNKNIFWDDKIILEMIENVNREKSQSSVDKFAQVLYDKTPLVLKYGTRDEMINDFRKVVSRIFDPILVTK